MSSFALRQHLAAIFSAALGAVDARRATARALQALDDEFARVERVWVVAAGKAAVGMAGAAADALGDRLASGVVTAAVGHGVLDTRWQRFPASHPLPSAASEEAGRAALAQAAATGPRDLLLVCLSGGASAMLAVPASGLLLADKTAATEVLLRAGLDISAMNTVRRHLSAIKGGQLAARAARTITLAISDVSVPIDDDPVVIGSGPTVGDATSFADALAVIEQAKLSAAMPRSVMTHLQAGAAGRALGPVAPEDPRLRATAYWVVASRQDAMRAAADTARRLGYDPHVRSAAIHGPARDGAARLLDDARRMRRPVCVISSGETTVDVKGTGRGGRNQELAVAAVERLASLAPAALASVGTDGIDGPTDAAGAMVDSGTWATLGSSARATCAAALDNNDVYPLLDRLGALVRTGPTGTNVGDLQVLLLGARAISRLSP